MEDCKLFECRLCLKMLPPNNCSVLTEDGKTVLKFIIPEVGVSETSDPTICNVCTRILEKAHKVKEKHFSNVRQKINNIDGILCTLCQKYVDVLEKQEGITVKEALHMYFPNLEIDMKETIFCCKACAKFLEEFFVITKNCQKTEEDVSDNCLGTGNNNQEAKPSGFEFISCDTIKAPDENTSTEDIKPEIGGNEIMTTSEEKWHKPIPLMIPVDRFYCANCSYSINCKSALISHMVSHRTLSEISFKCEICNHQTKRKTDLRAHMICHKSPTELKMFKCKQCPYEAKRNWDLKQHMWTHSTTIYKCEYCPFQTTNEIYLKKNHMLIHKDKLELKVYKCEKCAYQTTTKVNLKMHNKRRHSVLKGFTCNQCAFTTYQKVNLKDHMLSFHTPTSETQMLKCANCEFETQRKCNLQRHMLRHINSKTVTCEKCNSTFKNEMLLKLHMRYHKYDYKKKTFQCYTCGFVTKYKACLIAHIKAKHLYLLTANARSTLLIK